MYYNLGLSQAYQIQAMPTFIILLNNQERSRIQGGNMAEVERQILANIPKTSEKIASTEERNWLEKIVNYIEQVSKKMNIL